MSYAIRAEGLVKRFGSTTALAGVDLTVPAGTVFGLLGPRRAGKTTVVRVLATLVRPDGGRAAVGGYDLAGDSHQIRRILGLAGQCVSADESLTGSENLLLIGRLLDMPRAVARARTRELLAAFHLDDDADRTVRTYSDSMRRRLDLATGLVGRPQVLLLDEPTAGLGAYDRHELWDVIRELAATGLTVLVTTGQLAEADQLADEVAVLDHGRLLATGTPDELRATVGVAVLRLRPADPARLPLVMSIAGELAGAQPKLVQGTVTVPVTGPGVMPTVVRHLDEAGVPVVELTLRRSGLDEVFLALTGRRVDGTPIDDSPQDGTSGFAPTDRMPA